MSRHFFLTFFLLLLSAFCYGRGMVSFSGSDGRLLMTLPKRLLCRDMLMGSCVRSTTHYQYAEVGTRPQVFVAQWQRDGDRIALRQLSAGLAANDADSVELQAVAPNFSDYYVAEMPIVREGRDSVTMDVTRLFASGDVFSPFSRWFRKATVRYDEALSRIIGEKAFDDNFSVTMRMTYTVTPTSEGARLASSHCTAEVVVSALLLPQGKMRPRLADPRYGFFSETRQQYDPRVSDTYGTVEYVDRWDIRPADYDAWNRGKLVEPTSHIVFYLDDKFPESWKEPLRRGILEWNPVFRSFGLNDPIVVLDYPKDDPAFDPDNLKYSCIRYIPTDRGGAQGPSWADPRTGQTLSADVYVWGSLPDFVVKQDFALTAQANEAVRGGRLPEKDFSDHLTCTISHEIGHILGLAHNMAGSNAYSVSQMLDPAFVRENGLTASTMDYVYFNFIVPPGRTDVPLEYTNLGPYDKLMLRYIYYPTDSTLSVTDDYKLVSRFFDEHEGDARYRYSRQQWGTFWDPTVVNYDLTNEPLKAAAMGVDNLKYVVAHFNEWLAGNEKDGLRKALYGEVVNQFKTRLKNLLWYTGGFCVNQVRPGSGIAPRKAVDRTLQAAAFRQTAAALLDCRWIDRDMAANLEDAGKPASQDVAEEMGAEIAKLFKKVEKEEDIASAAGDEAYTRDNLVDDIYNMYFASQTNPSFVAGKLQKAIVKALRGSDCKDDAYARLLLDKIQALAKTAAIVL